MPSQAAPASTDLDPGRDGAPRYWLMKSEPEECSIDDALAAPGATVPWTGVRNYQARNFMRDGMRVGDGVLFYHSSCAEPGIAGIARVASGTRPDPTQFDPASPYHDPRSPPDRPRWLLLDVQALRKTRVVGLAELRQHPALADMRVLQRGNRLSITPVEPAEWDAIVQGLLAGE
ncbi:EVE domain-containing protein [Paracidovorax konjaci]|uniref:Predicted RNA-binding protein, contains PUA-like domain n=1 Tax=Paracidovorax konjaci TaxID=32040 RepID=A0A1I1WB50_9BURK|nr:EVE domain-containing protein [Paracidovorax konjaci]SFD92229.1 Predicted RNA-binding protein, contains PUA-like domain [Paracidovorax konjaci]